MPNSPHRFTRFGFVNAWLVEEDDGLTLIDTTMKGAGKKILAAADGLGAPIVRIVLTHAHGDHIGALDELAAALPEAEVIISTRDARLLHKDMSLDPGEPERKLSGSYPGAETVPSRTVQHGDRIGSLEVVATPGHTPGHIALLDPRDRTLYCGDVYSTLGGVASSAKANPRFPLVRMGTWSPEIDLESARILRALDPARLAPGHGKLVEAPGAAMDAAIARVG
ncbi:MBL fold metallo-hydrolase [Baekduia sp.]|jgi:glyoxylase-like metal-dependent hydrolase (beta-lactamase superfamily II)|uniref:MBL fold metallo-hydrolase n=1 Tax=Baekduia sp. TaxID=2600305 RepID=UPI002E0985F7|nr:MBL fold metallo-hydrolase [Baekduia sp.]